MNDQIKKRKLIKTIKEIEIPLLSKNDLTKLNEWFYNQNHQRITTIEKLSKKIKVSQRTLARYKKDQKNITNELTYTQLKKFIEEYNLDLTRDKEKNKIKKEEERKIKNRELEKKVNISILKRYGE